MHWAAQQELSPPLFRIEFHGSWRVEATLRAKITTHWNVVQQYVRNQALSLLKYNLLYGEEVFLSQMPRGLPRGVFIVTGDPVYGDVEMRMQTLVVQKKAEAAEM